MDPSEGRKFKKKYQKMKRIIKDLVFENAALCDQVAHIQEKVLIVREERKFLLKKLNSFQALAESDVQVQYQPPLSLPQTYPQANVQHALVPDASIAKKILSKKKISPEIQETVKMPKSKKNYSPIKAKKFVQPIPLDVTGRPLFPIVLGGPTVHSLGEVVSDRPDYHSEEFIFPVGFCSSRVYGSLRDPEKQCVYTCKVLDGGESPSFEIVADNELDTPLVAKTPDDCHALLLEQINSALGYDVVNIKGRGLEFFGLSHPNIQNLIQSCPGTRKCSRYKWSRFEVSRSADAVPEENDASLNFEALQRSIAFCKLYMNMIRGEASSELVTRENFPDLLMA